MPVSVMERSRQLSQYRLCRLISHHLTKKPFAFIQGHNPGSSQPFGLGRIQVRQLLNVLILVLMLAVEVLELLVRGQAIPLTDLLLLLTLLILAVFS